LCAGPDAIKPGLRSAETVCLVDLLATCADLLGVGLPANAGEDSVSNLPLWRGQTLDRALRQATVHHSADGSFSLRSGRWKLEMCPGSGGWSYPRPGDECKDLPPIQLYDLEADIGELQNVFYEHPDVVARLTALLTRYVRDGRSTPGAAQQNWQGVRWEQCGGCEVARLLFHWTHTRDAGRGNDGTPMRVCQTEMSAATSSPRPAPDRCLSGQRAGADGAEAGCAVAVVAGSGVSGGAVRTCR